MSEFSHEFFPGFPETVSLATHALTPLGNVLQNKREQSHRQVSRRRHANHITKTDDEEKVFLACQVFAGMLIKLISQAGVKKQLCILPQAFQEWKNLVFSQ
ncbi:MAG: hypothetical protein ONB44_19535 [candidate division KSB1 bacterium]|nr:hypothetical protein [candidate division KSB1 bacterium]MDZ7304323.1 hypothetical protein [candidate division KSB1 bacterium]